MQSEPITIRRYCSLVAAVFSLAAAASARAQDADTFDCIIEPNRVVEVGSAAVGVLQEVRVDRSDPVKAGQVLAVLESGVESATVDLARLRASIDTEVHARQISYELQRSNQVRTERLHATQAVALKTRDEAEHDARVSALRVRQAREEKRLAELELARAEQALARRTITSPVTGVVMERHKSEGERVEDQPILRIAELDPLRVEVVLPVDRYGTIVPGMRARVVPEFGPGGEYVARVTAIDPVLDAASGTFGVRLSMPNADHAVPGGLRCALAFLPGAGSRPESPVPENEAGAVNGELPAVEVTPAPDTPPRAPPQVNEARRDASNREEQAGAAVPVPVPKQAAVAMTQTEEKEVAPPVIEATPADAPQVSQARRDETHGENSADGTASVPAVEQVAVAMSQAPEEAGSAFAAPTACQSLGPIDSERTARRLRRAFATRDVEARLRAEQREVIASYLVTVEAARLDGGSAAAVEALQREGLSDYAVLRSDPNRVSVGVFKGPRSAQGRAERVKAIGLPVEVTPRTRERTRYFLDLDLPAAGDGEGLIRAVLASRGAGTLETVACPGIVTAGR